MNALLRQEETATHYARAASTLMREIRKPITSGVLGPYPGPGPRSGHHVQPPETSINQHSYLTDSAYPTLLAALTNWARGGGKPTPADIAAQCHGFEATFGHNCHFVPDYSPPSLDSRIVPRQRD